MSSRGENENTGVKNTSAVINLFRAAEKEKEKETKPDPNKSLDVHSAYHRCYDKISNALEDFAEDMRGTGYGETIVKTKNKLLDKLTKSYFIPESKEAVFDIDTFWQTKTAQEPLDYKERFQNASHVAAYLVNLVNNAQPLQSGGEYPINFIKTRFDLLDAGRIHEDELKSGIDNIIQRVAVKYVEENPTDYLANLVNNIAGNDNARVLLEEGISIAAADIYQIELDEHRLQNPRQ